MFRDEHHLELRVCHLDARHELGACPLPCYRSVNIQVLQYKVALDKHVEDELAVARDRAGDLGEVQREIVGAVGQVHNVGAAYPCDQTRIRDRSPCR